MRRIIVPVMGALASFGVLAACGDDATPPPATAPAGPITVEQLVARSADTPIDVQGFLHVAGGTARLCAAILESYPPQCGGPSVELVQLDLSRVEGLTTEGDVSWKEGVVLTLSRLPDARFQVITPFS